MVLRGRMDGGEEAARRHGRGHALYKKTDQGAAERTGYREGLRVARTAHAVASDPAAHPFRRPFLAVASASVSTSASRSVIVVPGAVASCCTTRIVGMRWPRPANQSAVFSRSCINFDIVVSNAAASFSTTPMDAMRHAALQHADVGPVQPRLVSERFLTDLQAPLAACAPRCRTVLRVSRLTRG